MCVMLNADYRCVCVCNIKGSLQVCACVMLKAAYTVVWSVRLPACMCV